MCNVTNVIVNLLVRVSHYSKKSVIEKTWDDIAQNPHL
jgi:hypothetical protein